VATLLAITDTAACANDSVDAGRARALAVGLMIASASKDHKEQQFIAYGMHPIMHNKSQLYVVGDADCIQSPLAIASITSPHSRAGDEQKD
jgi:hypothetical protein